MKNNVYRAYITNLGLYNQGELVGEWVDFPIDEKETVELLSRVKISDKPDVNGSINEEYIFTDYEGVFGELGLGENYTIENLNKLAKTFEDEDTDDVKLKLWLKDRGYDPDDLENVLADCENVNLIYPYKDDLDPTDENLAYSYFIDIYGADLKNLGDRILLDLEDILGAHFDEKRFIREYNIESSEDNVESLNDLGITIDDLDYKELAIYFDYDSFGRNLRLSYGFTYDDEDNVWYSLQGY